MPDILVHFKSLVQKRQLIHVIYMYVHFLLRLNRLSMFCSNKYIHIVLVHSFGFVWYFHKAIK